MRVALADDAVLFREGLALLLTEAGLTIIGQAGTGESLLNIVSADPPDVAIIDIKMPPTHTTEGLVAAQRIRSEHPDVGVLVLSQYVDPHYALALIGEMPEGAGYLLKDRVSDVDEFVESVRRVGSKGTVIDPAVVQELVARTRHSDPISTLSDRERDVLALMAEGCSNSAISQRLFLSPKTIESHVRSLFMKLGIAESPAENRRVRAVLTYLRA